VTPHLAMIVDSDPLLFLSGQLPFDADRQIGATDIAGQTRQVVANLAAVLAGAGLSLDAVVKTNVWIRHAADFAGFDAAYAEMFGAHRPARSTVVSDLVLPAALVEIEAIARRPATPSAAR
jgi:2-iminobutanoate/2-iminopropanoate deaminase